MQLFGKKKKEEETHIYDIYGGATVEVTPHGHRIEWKSPMVTSIEVDELYGDLPHIKIEGDYKLKILIKEGKKIGHLSKL